MTRVPVPAALAQVIGQRALQFAREDVQGRGWQSSGALQPYAADGEVGISTSVDYKYLMIQNQGFSPFVMWWVQDRTLPLKCAKGDGPHFRTGTDPGMPGWVQIPHTEGKTWRPQKWRHPGLKPKRFLESALTSAIQQSRTDIQREMMRILRGEA